jgi:putative transposase
VLAQCATRVWLHKTIYNRDIRWSRMGDIASLAAKDGKADQLMIDATHLKAHRTAASLFKKDLFPDLQVESRMALTPSCMPCVMVKDDR